jgi:pyruvate/2-oxoglutarate dehydrogenase complex dihydrolipoamide acyltransferase (E2) component
MPIKHFTKIRMTSMMTVQKTRKESATTFKSKNKIYTCFNGEAAANTLKKCKEKFRKWL